jgi:hypothetical protein
MGWAYSLGSVKIFSRRGNCLIADGVRFGEFHAHLNLSNSFVTHLCRIGSVYICRAWECAEDCVLLIIPSSHNVLYSSTPWIETKGLLALRAQIDRHVVAMT